jgi:hypothetical protein
MPMPKDKQSDDLSDYGTIENGVFIPHKNKPKMNATLSMLERYMAILSNTNAMITDTDEGE